MTPLSHDTDTAGLGHCGRLTQVETLALIALIPVDTTGLEEITKRAGVELPRPSIEHSLTTCDRCGRDCWIGPVQALKRAMRGTATACFWCLIPVIKGSAGVVIHSLDHSADTKPRRTGPPQTTPRHPA